jgi:predicted O-methyltransferase YrrM
MTAHDFPFAAKLEPRLLASPWWIGHIPFAFELVARLKPRTIVELGTYSGSSFAAFCQALEAAGIDGQCHGIDLWEGDIHMGKFDDSLYRTIADYVAANHPRTGVLVRKDFDSAAGDFADGSIDLLHIDGTHTYEAVSNDFRTWQPKLSSRSVVLFHDVNVTVENVGQPALKFGVRRFFDEVKGGWPHFEFAHCYGLGVLVTGKDVPEEVLELVRLSGGEGFREYFAARGDEVSRRFAALDVPQPVHSPYGDAAPAPLWRRAVRKLRRISREWVRA